jgi:hypothetical protein
MDALAEMPRSNSAKTPLIWYINSLETLPSTSLRAVSMARVSWASIDLQCTGRNQPSRINSAIPRSVSRSSFCISTFPLAQCEGPQAERAEGGIGEGRCVEGAGCE